MRAVRVRGDVIQFGCSNFVADPDGESHDAGGVCAFSSVSCVDSIVALSVGDHYHHLHMRGSEWTFGGY